MSQFTEWKDVEVDVTTYHDVLRASFDRPSAARNRALGKMALSFFKKTKCKIVVHPELGHIECIKNETSNLWATKSYNNDPVPRLIAPVALDKTFEFAAESFLTTLASWVDR